MADSKYDKYREAWAARSASSAPDESAEVATESPSPGRSIVSSIREIPYGFARGLAQAPGDVMSALGNALPFGGGFYGRPNPGTSSPANRRASADRQAQELSASLMARSGTTEPPEMFMGRASERFGRGAPYTAAAGPYLATLGGAKAVGLGVIGDVVSSMFEQTAEDRGAGPGVQMLAGIPAGIMMPTGIADDAADVARAGTRFTRRMASEAPAVLTDAHKSAIKSVARDFGTSDEIVTNAIQEWQRRMPRDPSGGRAFLDQAVEALQEARRLFPDPKKRPTVAQILGELGGANIGAMEAAIARDSASGVDLSSDIAGRKLAVVRDLEEQFEKMTPNAPTRSITVSTGAIRRQMADEASALWEAVPFDEMPMPKANKLWAAARRLKSGALAYQDVLPDELGVVDGLVKKYGRRIPVSELQPLRSRLQSTIAQAGNPLADPKTKQKAELAIRLLEPIEQMFDSLPKAGSAKYMRAREATRKLYEAFPKDSAAVRAMLTEESDARMIARVMSSPGEARIARKIAEMSPDGVDGLQRAAWNRLFGSDMGDFSPKALRRKLNKPGDREAYLEIFGPERMAKTDDFLKKVDIAGRFITGTPAQFRSTGSNVPMLHALLAGAEVVTEPVQSAGKFARKAMERIATSTDSAVERNAILMEALLDDGLAETLTAVPTARTWPEWQRKWDVLVGRAKLRARVGTASSAARSFQPGGDPARGGGVR